jgi:dodecin
MPCSICPRDDGKEHAMPDHVYKMVELVGSSETSIEDAIQTAVKRGPDVEESALV